MSKPIPSDSSGNGQEIVSSDLPRGPFEDRPAPANRLAGHAGASDGQFLSLAAEAPDDAAPDPFDLGRIRRSQDFASTLGVKKALLTVPVRKPSKEWFVRTHPKEDYRIQAPILELKEDRESYWVDPSLWTELSTEATVSPKTLVLSITRQNVLFLWPIRLPGADGKIDDWNRSALEAAEMAQSKWIRVAANMRVGAYDVFEATACLPDPEWPDKQFHELVRVAFKDRVIDSLDHPVLKRLRGEA